jgi:NAD(P) transhydrogenase subunit beta
MVGMGSPSSRRWRCPASRIWRLGLIVAGLAIGGGIGAVIARRIAMTAMPQLVAAFHSSSASPPCSWRGALYAPEAFGIGERRAIHGCRR